MVCVGYARVGFALGMYISCCLCPFHLRWVPNANPVFDGIWALMFQNSEMGSCHFKAILPLPLHFTQGSLQEKSTAWCTERVQVLEGMG